MFKCNKLGIFYNPHNTKTAEVVTSLLKERYVVDSLANPTEDVDAILMLGGDGLALRCMRAFSGRRIPMYGVNYGTVGFFMNDRPSEEEEGINYYLHKIADAYSHKLQHLSCFISGPKRTGFNIIAINDAAIMRANPYATRLCVKVNGEVQIPEVIGDGLVVSTAIGSTGYNYSLGGSVLPVKSNLMAITPIAVRKPQCWRGAILQYPCIVDIKTIVVGEVCKLSVDGIDYFDVNSVKITTDLSCHSILLFDTPQTLQEKSMEIMFCKSSI